MIEGIDLHECKKFPKAKSCKLLAEFAGNFFFQRRMFVLLKRAWSHNVRKLLSKRRFSSIFIGRITEIFHYFSQNVGVIFAD